MTFFFTLRGILGRTHDPHGFNEGGLLWFPDLTAADPYYILPVSCGATFFAMASIDVMGAGGPVDEKQQMMRNAMKVVAVMMVPMTASFESGVFVYWTTSNILTVAQSRALRTPEVRAAIGMPPLAATVGASGTASPGSYAPPLDKPFVPEVTYAKPPERAREPVAAKASQRKRRKRR
jgi:membrane protein insertase Oxa1/YidC/SpoIIIJ